MGHIFSLSQMDDACQPALTSSQERLNNGQVVLKNMDAFGTAVGLILVVLGLIIIKFGDREVGDRKTNGGIIRKLFSQQYVNPKVWTLNNKVLKWAVGLIAIWFGLALIISRGHL
jgi:hypothetical protein